MSQNDDYKFICEAIELFVVNYFGTNELAGSIKSTPHESINYFSIDLTSKNFEEEKVEDLFYLLKKYMRKWAKKNGSKFSNPYSISNITIDFILLSDGQLKNNISKHLSLFDLPSYFYRTYKKDVKKPYPKVIIKLIKIFYNPLLRNTIIVIVPTILLIIYSYIKLSSDIHFQERLIKLFDFLNIASGILASFMLGFVINKVLSIRNDKIKRNEKIISLSNKLTYFRSICYNFMMDHDFWSDLNPYKKAYEHGMFIRNKISYEDYYYPDFDDDLKYANFQSFYKKDISNIVVNLILQLNLMSGDEFLHSGLTYTKYPQNYIYSLDELENYSYFSDSNQIWISQDKLKIFPDEFRKSYSVIQMIEDIKRIYPERKITNLSIDLFEEVSLDFQYKFIPDLYRLQKINNSDLPYSIKYFTTNSILLLVFGILFPSISYVFAETTFGLFSSFIVLGIISHILLSLNSILKIESTVNAKEDII